MWFGVDGYAVRVDGVFGGVVAEEGVGEAAREERGEEPGGGEHFGGGHWGNCCCEDSGRREDGGELGLLDFNVLAVTEDCSAIAN